MTEKINMKKSETTNNVFESNILRNFNTNSDNTWSLNIRNI